MIESVGAGSLGASTWVRKDRAASPSARADQPASGAKTAANGTAALTDEAKQQVDRLRSTDTKVKQHEQAHASAGGAYAGAIQLTYTQGPDGKSYAVAGEVPIDTSPERDPDATIAKMETVKRAALAPADPSAQDRAVAQQADAQEAQARAEKIKSGSKGSGGASARAAAAYGNAAAIGTTASTYATSA